MRLYGFSQKRGKIGKIILATLVAATAMLAPVAQAAARKGIDPDARRLDPYTTRVTFAHAVQSAAPAVVNIYAARVLSNRTYLAQDPSFQGMLPQEKTVRERVSKSLGSGVIVRSDGLVVTNLHVIDSAAAIKVVLSDGREFPAKVLGQDDKLDLAVLRVDMGNADKLPVARWGDSDSLQVGDVVLALGNPFGIGQSVSFGVVSAVQRSAAALSQYAKFIQTDAAINPGNSGGALIDSTGAVVGINSAIFSRNGASAGIGFAVPSALVRHVVDDIARTGRVIRPWFGAEGESVTDAVAKKVGLPRPLGVELTAIVPESPAAKAGLRVGDVLLGLAGQPVMDPAALNEQIVSNPGLLNVSSPLVIWRNGQKQTISIVLTALPPRATDRQIVLKGYNPLSGAKVEPLSPALNVELGLPMNRTGVALIELSPNPISAFKTTLQPGDIILSVNGSPVRDAGDVQGGLDSDRKVWNFKVIRNGTPKEIMIR